MLSWAKKEQSIYIVFNQNDKKKNTMNLFVNKSEMIFESVNYETQEEKHSKSNV